MKNIIFFIIGLLIGSCAFFIGRGNENSDVEEILRKYIKITDNKLTLIDRKCTKMESMLECLTETVQHLKDTTIGEKVKIGNEYYLRGGMYGQVRIINGELKEVKKELVEIKQNVGSEFSITGISGKIDEIKKELNKIKEDIGSDCSITGISGKIDGIQQDINLIKLKLNL